MMKSIGTKLAFQIAFGLTIVMILFGILDIYQRQHEFTELLQAKEQRSMEHYAPGSDQCLSTGSDFGKDRRVASGYTRRVGLYW